MKITKFIVGTAITFLALASSCKKEKIEEPEPVTATITVTEPAQNDTIAFNEELHIQGTISGSNHLHGYEIKINDPADNELFSYDNHDHTSSYSFHQHWVNNLMDTTTVKVKIEVELDDNGGKTEKELTVVCLPQ